MITLKELAHARAGDKGDTSILTLIPYEARNYEIIKAHLTAKIIAEHFGNSVANVTIFPLEGLTAFNIVIKKQLDGGVTRARRVDRHGKTLAAWLLELPLGRTLFQV